MRTPESLLSYEEALAKINAASADFLLPSEPCHLTAVCGRVLAEEITAPQDVPPCDNSAMDGYCVRHQDVAGATEASPKILPVSGESMAGHPLEELAPGFASYIATGGMLPRNADTVIKIEDIECLNGDREIKIVSAPPKGTYIRTRGKDLKAGTVVLPPGTCFNPPMAGMLAALGNMAAKVARRPQVAILTSGDEVLMPFEEPRPWQVRNANTYTLAGQTQRAGAIPLDLGIVRDTMEQARTAVKRAFAIADVVVTCGGVSLGKKDPFIAAFRDMGIAPLIHGVSIKPGKPFFFGLYEGKPLFGLPGNQASCSVTFEIFVRPFLTRILGRRDPDRARLFLPIDRPAKNPTGRDHFIRGFLRNVGQKTMVSFHGEQDSHLLSSLVGAELLIRHPGHVKEIGADQIVECLLLDQC